MTNQTINAARFYGEWKGHPISDLAKLHTEILCQRHNKPIIYLAGDSSLDNKFWVPGSGPGGEALPVPVPAMYTSILAPPRPKPDVAFWFNHYLGNSASVLNTAVEESMLRDRTLELLPHDQFIRDHIRAEDVLIVSVGANDIALNPNFSTIRHMLQLAWLTPRKSLERGTAWSLGYFKDLFGNQVKDYVSRIVVRQRPRVVIICMIYFPLEGSLSTQHSWADLPLKLLGYNRYPLQLQAAIRTIYNISTKTITIPGTTVIPFALFDILDGKSEDDYTARVEPSVQGGRKIAEQLTSYLRHELNLSADV